MMTYKIRFATRSTEYVRYRRGKFMSCWVEDDGKSWKYSGIADKEWMSNRRSLIVDLHSDVSTENSS